MVAPSRWLILVRKRSKSCFDHPVVAHLSRLYHVGDPLVSRSTFPFLVIAFCLSGVLARADETLRIFPTAVQLTTTEATQRLIVQRCRGDHVLTQVHEGVRWESSAPQIVKVQAGVAVPVSNGQAILTARVGEQAATVEVMVTGQQQEFQWSFRNHVESVLSKSGCNGGACHGARAGQNGFRLTLFGFDLAADYSYLTRQARGRRIVPGDPGRSMLLTKPTGMLPHKGGVRFEVKDLEYRVLAEWIASGTPGPSDEDPVIERVEVFPKHSRQKPGIQQQLVVLAHFSDGHCEDVTRWAKYTSLNSNVAAIGKHGLVDVTGAGEGAIKVWYLNHNQLAFLSVPYANDVPSEVFANSARHNFVDDLILDKLASLNLPPSPVCDDATFIRRAFLDTLGILPTAKETREFLADPAPDKRSTLVDQLLARPEFVDYWAYHWSDLLLVTGARSRPKAVQAYYGWIRDQVADNLPWDKLVYELVTASGSTFENGAANFYALHQSPEEMAETVSQAFMGLSINCAKCHNHPLEKWTNDQYYGMAGMFARVRGKKWGGDFRNDSFQGERVIFSDVRGEIVQPSLGKPQPPRPLDAPPVAFDDMADRRLYLARWLTSPENPYFTRAIANRVWANFFGVGLVEAVDDLRLTNPASNEILLDAIANYLVENQFDLKELMRVILKSAAYQRSSIALPENAADSRFYSHYYPRRLKAEVLLDAMSTVTDVPSQFKDKERGTRALQLADASVDSYFLSTFGRPDRIITCDCERTDEPSMTQVLHLYNGDTLNAKLQAKDNVVDDLLRLDAPEQIVNEAYLRALSRLPTDAQRDRLVAFLKDAPAEEKRAVVEDLFWSVLSSREFLFNH